MLVAALATFLRLYPVAVGRADAPDQDKVDYIIMGIIQQANSTRMNEGI